MFAARSALGRSILFGLLRPFRSYFGLLASSAGSVRPSRPVQPARPVRPLRLAERVEGPGLATRAERARTGPNGPKQSCTHPRQESKHRPKQASKQANTNPKASNAKALIQSKQAKHALTQERKQAQTRSKQERKHPAKLGIKRSVFQMYSNGLSASVLPLLCSEFLRIRFQDVP